MSIFFNDSDYPEQLDVHFTVNMAHQVNLENFDPAEDFVWVRGNFNDWGTADQMQAAYTNEVDTILYEYTLDNDCTRYSCYRYDR
jgi:1,4-alpha-glucan branching enzyme